jgi:hypothetical protein
MKILIVTGADHNYFPLMREMIYSVKKFPQAGQFDFAVLDGGLDREDLKWLRQNVNFVHAPEWPNETAKKKAAGKNHLKSCVCRPWINTYFPGYDLYIWMDADTWVQDWSAIDLYIKGAANGKLAASGQVDRGYPRSTRIKWLGPLPIKLSGFYFSNAKRAFGLGIAKKLFPYHVLQAGVFALRGDAPHWKHWQELVLKAVKRGKVFTAEQLTMGVMCHLDGYPVEILPAWTNWLCEFPPPFDAVKGKFVESYLPHHPIGIMHISGYDQMRKDRSVLTELPKLDGSSYQGTLRIPDYDGECDMVMALEQRAL